MKTIIFAGGNGTRLWPVSRTNTPKQFSRLVGEKSLFELTVDRMLKRFSFKDIYVVIPKIYVEIVKGFYPDFSDEQIIIEPFKWDTLACIGYAGFIMNKRFPNDNLFLVWSDHIINDEDKFLDIIEIGDIYAIREKKIIKIGAKTTYPETNWGYIKFKDKVDEIRGIQIYAYERHFEKPDLKTAKQFISSFDYLWNMGYMIWPAGELTKAYKKYSPETYTILEKISDPKFSGNIVEEYKKITKNSIDYEILEKAEKSSFVVIPADVGWNDVGDWSSLKTQLENDKESNVTLGDDAQVILLDSKDIITYQSNTKKKIVVIGLEDIAVIDTGDVLLVASKKASRDVKKIVEQLSTTDPSVC